MAKFIKRSAIVVSMTSYPARIHCVYDAYKSILEQNVDKSLYHCVLVLAEPEFPNKKDDLPENLVQLMKDNDIELIWTEKNIMSHKKLMPTLARYKKNPILIVDDDIIRPQGWLETFMHDHEKWPNDIICGTFAYHYVPNTGFKRFSNVKLERAQTFNDVPAIVFNTARPGNGFGGVLYPAGTFTRPEFFDEDLFMKLSPTSDESWQFCFNIMEDRHLRQLSKVYDYSKNFIGDTQSMKTALHKVNKNKYESIFKTLCEVFPEFKEKMIERSRRVVISLTTYPKRFEHLVEVLDTLVNQTVTPYKILLVIDKPNIEYITPEIVDYIAAHQDLIEVILSENPIKPHEKYYFAMQKYRYCSIITVDDDVLYDKRLVEKLLESYIQDPSRIHAARVHKITFDKNGVRPYKSWIYQYNRSDINPSHTLFATGVGGVLYPPDCLNISEDNLPEIQEFLLADDIYLKKLEIEKNLKVVFVPGIMNKELKQKDYKDYSALYKINVVENKNDEYLSKIDFSGIMDEVNCKPGVISFRAKTNPNDILLVGSDNIRSKTMVFKSKYTSATPKKPVMVFKTKHKL